MEKAATDIYTFKKLREGGFTYVDKTGLILPLVDNSIGSQFFIARPRPSTRATSTASSRRSRASSRTFPTTSPTARTSRCGRRSSTSLAQIERNNYAEKYDFAGKRVFKVGVSFSSEKRTIVDVKTASA